MLDHRSYTENVSNCPYDCPLIPHEIVQHASKFMDNVPGSHGHRNSESCQIGMTHGMSMSAVRVVSSILPERTALIHLSGTRIGV